MLTSTKAAKEIGLSKKTFNRLAKDGRIPSIVLPSGHRRFDVAEVKAALSTDLSSVVSEPVEERDAQDNNSVGGERK